MQEKEGRGKPGQGNTFEEAERQQEHNRLVAGFRAYIDQQRQFFPSRTPEEILRDKLEFEKRLPPPKSMGEGAKDAKRGFFEKLQFAWEIMTYERYEIGTREEMDIHSNLARVAVHYHNEEYKYPTIYDKDDAWVVTLDPLQTRIVDAMADVAAIPHERGQNEFTVPRKLRNSFEYIRSPEYLERYNAHYRKLTGRDSEDYLYLTGKGRRR